MTTKKELERPLKCPDCEERFSRAQVLGKHRQLKHGYVSTDKNAQYRAKVKARAAAAQATKQPPRDESLKCPHCEFVAKWKGGLTHHIRASHSEPTETAQPIQKPTRRAIEQARTQALAITNGHATEEAHTPANGIPEATLALALGRFQGLCTSMATEFDLPPRLFAARLAEFIFRATLR